MTARIEVVTAVLDNVLTLPVTVVTNTDGKYIVYLASLIDKEPKQIKISHIVGTKVVISRGLSLGDEVIQ